MKYLPLVIAALFAEMVDAADLLIRVENITSSDGSVYLALYSSEETYDKKAGFIDSVKLTADDNSVETIFTGLEPGVYAVTVFHDVNNNEKFDRGWLGRPKEPYGFSRDATGNMGPPSFTKASLSLANDDVRDTITLRK